MLSKKLLSLHGICSAGWAAGLVSVRQDVPSPTRTLCSRVGEYQRKFSTLSEEKGIGKSGRDYGRGDWEGVLIQM